MNNHRKKVSSNAARQSEAHYKNLFCRKVLEIAKAVCVGDAYKYLTSRMLDDVYLQRIRTLKLVANDDLNCSSKDLQHIKEVLISHLRSKKVVLNGGDYSIDFYDLLGPCLSLHCYLLGLFQENHGCPEKIRSGFIDFMEAKDLFDDSFHKICKETNYIGWQLTSLDKEIITIKMSFKTHESNTFLYPEFRIIGYRSKVIQATFKGNTRPAFRVGLAYSGGYAIWSKINAGTLHLPDINPETKIPVYIQHHAMQRLTERLDCASNMVILLNLVDSINEPKCIDYNGRKLLQFNYMGKVIGYLVIEMFHRAAIIRTFLLLTHANTPESEELRKIIGLEKLDINYLNLNKLSTFVHSDIRENKVLVDIFTQAGCKALFEVKKHAYDKKCIVPTTSFVESFFSKYQEYNQTLNLSEIELLPAG